jgi:uncharacterized protein with HEPN domain
MLDAAHEAIEFAQGRTRVDLNGDRKLVLALVKDIEIIGEAAYQVSQTARDQLPGIPWDDIIGMRHRLVHAVRDNDIEINHIEFLIDPDSPIPLTSHRATHLETVDYVYITEQIEKCDSKIASGDFEGAITNARNLIESICKYILDGSGAEYDAKADLPSLYKEAAKLLNMHPSQHVESALKQILSGCFSIVHGFATVRNELSDAHGKSSKRHYKPDERHAMFVVGTAKTLADFIYASFTERNKPTQP